ncbi:MAG: hypothetical protein Q8N39_07415 [Pelolinea sp.]|nr:hypothetical protein [Pelolinea sp.]
MSNNRRLREYDYRQSGGYFITINSWHRFNASSQILNGEIILSDQGKIIEKCWLEIPKHFKNIDLGVYAIMPDHFHGIVIINYALTSMDGRCEDVNDTLVTAKHASQLPDDMKNGTKPGSLSAIIQSFKSSSTKLIHSDLNINNPIWQRSFYDHIIRDESELRKIHDYIVNNSSQWPGNPAF